MFWWIKNSFWTFIPGHIGNHSHCTAQCTDIIGSLQFSLYFHLLLGEEHLNVITMQSFTLHGRGNIPQGSVDFKAKCAQGENIVKEIELVHLLPHTFKATYIFSFKTYFVQEDLTLSEGKIVDHTFAMPSKGSLGSVSFFVSIKTANHSLGKFLPFMKLVNCLQIKGPWKSQRSATPCWSMLSASNTSPRSIQLKHLTNFDFGHLSLASQFIIFPHFLGGQDVRQWAIYIDETIIRTTRCHCNESESLRTGKTGYEVLRTQCHALTTCWCHIMLLSKHSEKRRKCQTQEILNFPQKDWLRTENYQV